LALWLRLRVWRWRCGLGRGLDGEFAPDLGGGVGDLKGPFSGLELPEQAAAGGGWERLPIELPERSFRNINLKFHLLLGRGEVVVEEEDGFFPWAEDGQLGEVRADSCLQAVLA